MRSKYIAVPASMFGMVLGIVGLGGSWRIAARVWALPARPSGTLWLIARGRLLPPAPAPAPAASPAAAAAGS